MIGVEFKQKKFFFDRKFVASEIGAANAKALSRHGAFVQRRARSSLRRRKRVSLPGEPPSVHTDHPVASLKNIWFAYDPARQSVVIGPLRLNLHSAIWGPEGRTLTTGAVPGLLEHGGRFGQRQMRQPDGTYRRVPFGYRRKAERLVPVWKATPEEKAASAGIVTIFRHTRTSLKPRPINFYRIPNPPSVITWHTMQPRPFMGPAGQAELAKDTSGRLWRAA